MIKDVDVDRFIKSIPANVGRFERHRTFMKLVCSCLPELSVYLPDVALSACRIAEVYWKNQGGNAQDLDAAREQCWNYLDEIDSSTSLTSPSVIAIRAVICALFPEPEGDDFDDETLRWFVMLLNKLGNYSDLVNPLLLVNSNKLD